MAFPGSSIVPKKLVESGHDLNAQPVGSGPVQVRQLPAAHGDQVRAQPDYFQAGKPYFDAMEYRIISDITALTNAVMSGQANFSNEIPAKDWSKVKSNPSLAAQTLEGSRYYWLLPNNTTPPLDNPKVRQAIGGRDQPQGHRAGRLLRPGDADPGRRGPAVELGLRRPPLLQARGRPDAGQAAPGRGGPPGRLRDLDDHRLLLPAHGGHGADHPGQPAGGRHQGQDRHDGDPALSGTRSGRPRTSTSRRCTGCRRWPIRTTSSPTTTNAAWRSTSRNTAARRWTTSWSRRRRAPTQDERKALYKQMQELSLEEMGQVPLVNGWLLIAHTKKLQNYKPMRTGFLKTLKDAWLESLSGREEALRMLRLVGPRASSPSCRRCSRRRVVLFIAINVVPGSAARSALGIDATPQAIARFEAENGLDRPLYLQYGDWLRQGPARRLRHLVPEPRPGRARDPGPPAGDARARGPGLPDRQPDRRAAGGARRLAPPAAGRHGDHASWPPSSAPSRTSGWRRC